MQTVQHTLYVVRHGENPANLNREFSYKLIDYSLTPRGVRQAEDTATFFSNKGIHAIYSSPLKRALETAESIARPLGLPVTIIEEFRENNVGDLESQPVTDENWALHDRIIADWYAGRHDVSFPGGESFLGLIARIRAGLTQVLTEVGDAQEAQRIVIVAHGGILSGMARGIAHEPDLALVAARRCENCSVTEFAAQLAPDGLTLHMRDWAACEHLT